MEPPTDVTWRKHLALLIYLALSPEYTRTRSHLVGLLWADKPEANARRSLNEAVRRLRAGLGADRIRSNGERLVLAHEDLHVDVLEFEDGGQVPQGEFLEGFHVEDGAEAFESWADGERARLRDSTVHILMSRGDEQLAALRYVEARELARRAQALRPYFEPAVALGMKSASLEGDRAGALSLYHDFHGRLETDLHEEPTESLTRLAQRIRESSWRSQANKARALEPPLVGRRDVHAKLFGAIDRAASGQRRAIAITGDEGMGRSRLLDACVDRLSLNGAYTVLTRPFESDVDTPWSTLRSLLRRGLSEAPGLLGAPQHDLQIIGGVAPDLAERFTGDPGRDAAEVADALNSILEAIAEEQPVAILLDDAQWADDATLDVLRSIWTRPDDTPLILIITADSSVDGTDRFRDLLGTVGREVEGTQVRLEPFELDDVRALVEAMAQWASGPDEQDRLARRVALESGGNPFVAVTLLRDLGASEQLRLRLGEWPPPGGTFDSPLPVTLSSLIRNALASRFARLDEDAAAILRAACGGGDVIHPDLLEAVTGLGTARVDSALDRLERRGFVRFTGERYVFSGRMVRRVVARECMRAGGRKRLKEQYVEILAQRPDLESQLLHAEILVSLDRRDQAFQVATGVVEQALSGGARRSASRALRFAQASVGPEDGERQQALAAFQERLEA